MKTLRKILTVVSMCLVALVIFVSCSCTDNFDDTGVGNFNNPQTVGNGGLAVISGGYLYFVNGYSSKSENYSKNEIGKQTKGAIYRVLLDSAGYITNEDEVYYNGGDYEIATETVMATDEKEVENKNIKDAKLVVGKKVGFEYGGFYIFGDFIYYITPSNKYNKNGSKRTEEVDFCRIRLNGENNEVITSVDNYDASSEFAFYFHNGNVYGVISSGSELIITKNNKKIDTKSGVSNVVLPVKTSFNFEAEQTGEYASSKVVAFMVGNELWKYQVGDADFTKIRNIPAGSTLIKSFGKFDGIYYLNSESVYKYLATKSIWLFDTNSTDIKIMEPGVFVEKTDSKLFKRLENKNYIKEDLIAEDINIESYLKGDCYYTQAGDDENAKVLKVNVNTNATDTVFTPKNSGTLKTENKRNIFTLADSVYYFRLNSNEFKTQGYYLESSTSTGSFIKTPLGFKVGDDNVVIVEED